MAVTLRLSRIGKKHVPMFRIVATDSRNKRDGACLEVLGTYDALKTAIVTINMQGIQDWISKGAQVSDSVKRIIKKYKAASKPVETKKATPKKSTKKEVKEEIVREESVKTEA